LYYYYKYQSIRGYKKLEIAEKKQREWSDLFVGEFYVFIGAIIYIGVYKGRETFDAFAIPDRALL
jgi:hypothetical protein